MFYALVRDLGLCLANTTAPIDHALADVGLGLDAGADYWTQRQSIRSGGFRYRLIDFSAAPHHWDVFAFPLHHFDCCSDHKPLRIWARFTLCRQEQRHEFRASNRGWQPRDGQAKEQLHSRFRALGHDPTVAAIQNCCTQAAREVAHATFKSRSRPPVRPENDPPDIKDIKQQLAECSSSVQRDGCSRKLARAKRKWRRFRQKLKDTQFEVSNGTRKREFQRRPEALELGGKLEYDRSVWSHSISDHFENKYKDDTNNFEQQSDRLSVLASCASEARDDNDEDYLHLDFFDFLQARNGLRQGAGTGKDGVAAEMFREIPWDVLVVVHEAFEKRINDIHGGPDDIKDWKHVLLDGLAKKRKAVKLRDWRVIGAGACLQKWYEACLSTLSARLCSPLPPEIKGFRRGHQALEITETVRILLEKAREWGLPIAVGSFDVETAFASLRHKHIMAGYLRRGAPFSLVCAIMRELSHVWISVQINGATSSRQVPLCKGTREGAQISPEEWNTAIAPAIHELAFRWHVSGYGFDLSDGNAYIIDVWADNNFLVAKSVGELQLMLNDLAVIIFEKLDLVLKSDDSKWMANSIALATWEKDGEPPVCVPATGDRPSYEAEKVDVMRILGVFVDSEGQTATAVDHRLAAGQRKWASSRRHLCRKSRSLREQFKRYYNTIGPTVLWGASGWNLGADEARKLDSFDAHCQRQMLALPRLEGENWVTYLRRANGIIRVYRAKWRLPTLLERAVALTHRWFGHVQRLPHDRPIRQAVNFRSYAWWRSQCDAMSQLDPQNTDSWRHPKPGCCRMWERQFHQAGLQDIQTTSANRRAWKQTESEFVRNKLQRIKRSKTDIRSEVSKTFEAFYVCAEATKQAAYSTTEPRTNEATDFVQHECLVSRSDLRERFKKARLSQGFKWPFVLVSGDNKNVCSALAGRYNCKAHRTPRSEQTDGVDWVDWGARAIGDLYKLYKSFGMLPPPGEVGNFVWRPRAYNALADALANQALDDGNRLDTFDEGIRAMLQDLVRGAAGGYEGQTGWLWARFDGAARVREHTGVGEAAYGVALDWVNGDTRAPILREQWRIGVSTAHCAEYRGAARATHILLSIVTRLADVP